MTVAIADTGLLIAFLDRAEAHHNWAVKQIASLEPPLLVCEPVLAEAFYLLRRFPAGCEALWQLAESGAVQIEFSLAEHVRAVRRLVRRYVNVPMSLADACIVRMAEIHDACPILTLDSDFLVYRKNGQNPLTLIWPGR